MQMIRRLALAAALVFSSVGAAAAQPAQVPIYADGLASGWSNWSWANVTLGVNASDGERPLMVEAAGWTALYLQHAPIDTAGYTKVSFYINGGAQGGQTLQVIATGAGNEPIADSAFRFTAPANQWGLVEAPLAELGAANTQITGFWIQNGSPNQAAPFFVNFMALE